MSTFFQTTENANAQRDWVLIDAKDKPVGRLASEVASILRGKRSTSFAKHTDTGSFVVVINASQVVFTGNKAEQKEYHYHTGYVGGLKTISAGKLLKSDPAQIVIRAVRGMLPKTPMGRKQLNKLKVYPSGDHPHSAQKPKIVEILR
jgi:large subunit ribosomal protein L13